MGSLDLVLWFMNDYEVESVMGSVFYKMKDKPDGNVWGNEIPKKLKYIA